MTAATPRTRVMTEELMSHQKKFPADDVGINELAQRFDNAFPSSAPPRWTPPPKAGLVIFVVSVLVIFAVVAALMV